MGGHLTLEKKMSTKKMTSLSNVVALEVLRNLKLLLRLKNLGQTVKGLPAALSEAQIPSGLPAVHGEEPQTRAVTLRQTKNKRPRNICQHPASLMHRHIRPVNATTNMRAVTAEDPDCGNPSQHLGRVPTRKKRPLNCKKISQI
jgi:hypothetical protein